MKTDFFFFRFMEFVIKKSEFTNDLKYRKSNVSVSIAYDRNIGKNADVEYAYTYIYMVRFLYSM